MSLFWAALETYSVTPLKKLNYFNVLVERAKFSFCAPDKAFSSCPSLLGNAVLCPKSITMLYFQTWMNGQCSFWMSFHWCYFSQVEFGNNFGIPQGERISTNTKYIPQWLTEWHVFHNTVYLKNVKQVTGNLTSVIGRDFTMEFFGDISRSVILSFVLGVSQTPSLFIFEVIIINPYS